MLRPCPPLQINLHRFIESCSVPEVMRDEIISMKFDLSQPGTSSVRHHPVDPSELLCGQLGPSQVNLLQT